MDLTRQIIELLSVPPGSFIYHLVTLFALQVVFAISYSRWRHHPEDDHARNMSWAAGAIFAGRLLLLFAGLYFGRDPELAAGVLPPLEQAINTASIALLVWSLMPSPDSHPRALDILLIATLILTGVMYLFFAQEWRNLVSTGVTTYLATPQATVWSLVAITILAVGLAYLIFRGQFLGAFPPIIVGTLLTAHIIQLWNYPEFVPTDTNVAYWIRLGNLIALPLWAVYTYLHTMTPLLSSASRLQASLETFGSSFEQAAQLIATRQPQRRLAYALQLANDTFNTSFAAIGLIDVQGDDSIDFYGALPDQGPAQVRKWTLELANNAIFGAAITQDRPTEILRDGLGSRQLYNFFEAAGLEPASSLMIHALNAGGKSIGLLVLPSPGSQIHWPDEVTALVPGLAHFIAQALLNSQKKPVVETAPAEAELQPVVSPVPTAIVMDKARVKDLEYELAKLRDAFAESESKRRQAESNALSAQKQARYLAAALRAAQIPAGQPPASDEELAELPGQEDAQSENQH